MYENTGSQKILYDFYLNTICVYWLWIKHTKQEKFNNIRGWYFGSLKRLLADLAGTGIDIVTHIQYDLRRHMLCFIYV